ncbi:MAG: clostripain-related cysteine peptidase [Spirochaetes bacterium]|nr:clostripain-related cysteine peptidase [Spirochaetota bacterium]
MKVKTLFFLFLLSIIFIFFFGCKNPTEKKEEDVLSRKVNPYDYRNENPTINFKPTESWTFMIYLDADNDLEQAGIDDFYEMVNGLNGLNKTNIKVIVLIDRISGYNNGNNIEDLLGESSDWTGARLYEINQNGNFTKKTDGWFADGAEINMGDPATLSNFISYCKTKYPSSHYALVLWNHGGGARSKTKAFGSQKALAKAVCWDETNSDDCLYLDEVQNVISQHFSTVNKLDFIGFDACLMGTVEVAYEFRDLAKVMAGSMAKEWGDGWDYNRLFSNMSGSGSNDPKELGKLVVWQYKESTSSEPNQTQSAVDLSKISTLKTAIDNLAVAIYNENKKTDIETLRDFSYHFYKNDDESVSYPYYDLNDICYQIKGNSFAFSSNLINKADAVINALADAIIWAYADSTYGGYYGSGTTVKRGLSIFFSRGNLIENNYSHYSYQWWYTSMDTNQWWPGGHYYGKIDFADSDTDGVVETWRELMEAWYDPGQSNYTPGKW